MGDSKKTAYIMRGIAGVGKSTLAKALAGENGVVHSTNDLFYVDGAYEFDREMLSTYHDQNFEAFCDSLDNNISIVICDNTNSRHREYERYMQAAYEEGYEVNIVYLQHEDLEETVARSPHDPPLEVVLQMEEDWQY